MPHEPITFDGPAHMLPEVVRAERKAVALVAALIGRRELQLEHARSRRWNAEQLAALREERAGLGEMWTEVIDLGEAGA